MSFFLVSFLLFGLCIGSFLNVCIHRIPRRESVVFPGSHCPGCGGLIRFYDNIPIVSFILLGGKCRFCRKRISFRYPFVELLTGAAFLFSAMTWGSEPPTFLNSIFLGLLIVLVFIDYDHQILPDSITLPGIALGFLFSPLQSQELYHDAVSWKLSQRIAIEDPSAALPWIGSAFGALVGAGLLLSVAYAYQLVRKRQGLGMGDVKMMALVGAFMGWRLSLLTIFAGSFIGSIAGVFLILYRGGNLQAKLAFGTFLGVGAALSLFFGVPLLAWYMRL